MNLYWTIASIPELRELSPARRRAIYYHCMPALLRQWRWWAAYLAVLALAAAAWIVVGVLLRFAHSLPAAMTLALLRLAVVVGVSQLLTNLIDHHMIRPHVRRKLGTTHCATCGYDLRASAGRCPECGQSIPPDRGGATAHDGPSPPARSRDAQPPSPAASPSTPRWYWGLRSIPELAPLPPEQRTEIWLTCYPVLFRQWQGWAAILCVLTGAALAIWLCVTRVMPRITTAGVFASVAFTAFIGLAITGVASLVYTHIVCCAIRPHLHDALERRRIERDAAGPLSTSPPRRPPLPPVDR